MGRAESLNAILTGQRSEIIKIGNLFAEDGDGISTRSLPTRNHGQELSDGIFQILVNDHDSVCVNRRMPEANRGGCEDLALLDPITVGAGICHPFSILTMTFPLSSS